MFGLLELIDPRAAKPYHTRTASEQYEISQTAAFIDATTLFLCSLIILSAAQYAWALFTSFPIVGISAAVGFLSFYMCLWKYERQYLAALERNKALIGLEGGLSQGQATMLSELQIHPYHQQPSSVTNQLLAAAHIGLDIIDRHNNNNNRDQKRD